MILDQSLSGQKLFFFRARLTSRGKEARECGGREEMNIWHEQKGGERRKYRSHKQEENRERIFSGT